MKNFHWITRENVFWELRELKTFAVSLSLDDRYEGKIITGETFKWIWRERRLRVTPERSSCWAEPVMQFSPRWTVKEANLWTHAGESNARPSTAPRSNEARHNFLVAVGQRVGERPTWWSCHWIMTSLVDFQGKFFRGWREHLQWSGRNCRQPNENYFLLRLFLALLSFWSRMKANHLGQLL